MHFNTIVHEIFEKEADFLPTAKKIRPNNKIVSLDHIVDQTVCFVDVLFDLVGMLPVNRFLQAKG